MQSMQKTITSTQDMINFGTQIGRLLRGGEFIELVGDIGAGKTTLTKGIAVGMNITDTIQSPTFTISRVYDSPSKLRLVHYDFYRLTDAGIMADELAETASDEDVVTVIEWGDVVASVRPADYLQLQFSSPQETKRLVIISAYGPRHQALQDELK